MLVYKNLLCFGFVSQRLSSQDKESSVKRLSGIGIMNYRREESQKPHSRPSTDVLQKWNSSNASENRKRCLLCLACNILTSKAGTHCCVKITSKLTLLDH